VGVVLNPSTAADFDKRLGVPRQLIEDVFEDSVFIRLRECFEPIDAWVTRRAFRKFAPQRVKFLTDRRLNVSDAPFVRKPNAIIK
jgi:hypothetical protein